MKKGHAGKELRQLLLSPKCTDEAPALCKNTGGQKIQGIPEATIVITHWVVLTHQLFCSAHLLIQAQLTVEASNRDPCPLTVQNSLAHQTFVQAIAEHFHMVSDVNLQGHQFPHATILGIHDLEAWWAL